MCLWISGIYCSNSSERCFSDSYGLGTGFCLGENYNKMVLPLPEVGPVKINISEIYLTDIFTFNNDDDTITIGLIMYLKWIDERIRFHRHVTGKTHGINEIWMPDIELKGNNKKLFHNEVKRSEILIRKKNNTTYVNYATSMDLDITCPTSYSQFPFDLHTCKVIFSSFSHNVTTIILTTPGAQWPLEQHPTKPRDYDIELLQLDEKEKVRNFGKYGFFSATGFKIKFIRRYTMYVLMYYIPFSMFVIISLISFFIPPTAYPARFGLLITTILVLVNMFNNVVNSTPKDAKGLTAIVFWMLGCSCFVFSTLISYAGVIIRIRVIDHRMRNVQKVKPTKTGDSSDKQWDYTRSQNFIDMLLFFITSFSFIIFIFMSYVTFDKIF